MDKRNVWNPILLIRDLWRYRELIKQLTKREVSIRYKGSYLGILWSLITPLLMLLVFTFVFGVIFQSRWGTSQNSNKIEFALILFCGLTVFNLFAECVNRAPGIILSNVNYVKRVVFPLEILPVVALGSALVNATFSFLILIVGLALFLGIVKWTLVFIPVVLLPLLLFILGLSWFLASLGVFLRDIGQVIGVITQALMFLSPIFYPVTVIPKEFRPIYHWNPISYVVEDMRRIMVWGQLPEWHWLLLGTIISAFVAFLGYVWFQKTRKGFADVL